MSCLCRQVGRILGYSRSLQGWGGGGRSVSGHIGMINWNCLCETLVYTYRTTLSCSPEDHNLNDYPSEIQETYNDSLFYSLTLKKTRMNQTQTVIIS